MVGLSFLIGKRNTRPSSADSCHDPKSGLEHATDLTGATVSFVIPKDGEFAQLLAPDDPRRVLLGVTLRGRVLRQKDLGLLLVVFVAYYRDPREVDPANHEVETVIHRSWVTSIGDRE